LREPLLVKGDGFVKADPARIVWGPMGTIGPLGGMSWESSVEAPSP